MDAQAPERLTSRIAYENPWLSVREDTFRRADGSVGLYGVVDKRDFALVIPEEGTGRERGFHLVEQYRYPIDRRSWEFPMGTWPPGATGGAPELARAELREETGLTADRWRRLGYLHHAPGFCSQGFDVFHATGLTAGDHDREQSEADMVTRFVPETEFVAMVADGTIFDGATLAAYLLLRLRTDRDDDGG